MEDKRDQVKEIIEDAMSAAIDDCHDSDSEYWGPSLEAAVDRMMVVLAMLR